MEFFLRTFAIYLFLLVLFRLSGKRTLSELSTFDFVLLLIISEATQNALIGDDKSVVAGMAVILTLVLLDLAMSYLKRRFNRLEKIAEGVPLVLVDQGKIVQEHLAKSNVTRSDILLAARQSQGLERMSQIKYAVLETSGGISIIPMKSDIDEMTRRIGEEVDRRIEAALDRRLAAFDRSDGR